MYCTETRPYNQGSRLTAYEAVAEGIPATLITDSMAALTMREMDITGLYLSGHFTSAVRIINMPPFLFDVCLPLAVVVGADRVVANGDTANKVGTYQLAIAAKHHGIPFYVAAPSTSCDLSLESGRDIIIEVRPPEELTSINGVPIAAPGKTLQKHSRIRRPYPHPFTSVTLESLFYLYTLMLADFVIFLIICLSIIVL